MPYRFRSINWLLRIELKYVCSNFMFPFASYKVVSLQEIFTRLKNAHEYEYCFDIKMDIGDADYVEWQTTFAFVLYSFIEQHQIHSKVFVESTNIEFMQHLQAKDPQLRLMLYSRDVDLAISEAEAKNFYGITTPLSSTSFDDVHRAHQKGLFVILWEAKTKKENRQAIELNPDIIQTDKVDYLVKILK